MAFEPSSLHALLGHDFDTVIDVRSPAEFAEDHVPGAINLPALSNEERAVVGTIYVQEDPFKARKIGAAMVAKNVARHLEGALADKTGALRPLVYCWRGGQRSGSVASIFQQIGWRAETLAGGYQSYRRQVNQRLYDDPWPLRVILLDGNTGTAKTELLVALAERGVQTLDLERLANHRGSRFGAMGPQPHQKAFDSSIAKRLVGYDPNRPVLIEAESAKVGSCNVPPSLWKAMKGADRITVTAPVAARADYLTRVYADLSEAPDLLRERLTGLKQLVGGPQVEEWTQMVADGAFHDLADGLIRVYYDPLYVRSRRGRGDDHTYHTETLDPAGIETLADAIVGDALFT